MIALLRLGRYIALIFDYRHLFVENMMRSQSAVLYAAWSDAVPAG